MVKADQSGKQMLFALNSSARYQLTVFPGWSIDEYTRVRQLLLMRLPDHKHSIRNLALETEFRTQHSNFTIAQQMASFFKALSNAKNNLEASFKELQNIKAPSSAPKVNALGNNHCRPSVGSPEVANAKCSEEDLTTWTHLSVDRKGAVLHTVDLREHGSESHRRI